MKVKRMDQGMSGDHKGLLQGGLSGFVNRNHIDGVFERQSFGCVQARGPAIDSKGEGVGVVS